MDEIAINSGTLRRLLTEYFRLQASEAARVTVLNEARSTSPEDSQRAFRNLQGVMTFVETHKRETERQREQNRYLEDSLLAALDDSDGGAFRQALDRIFPPRRHPEE